MAIDLANGKKMLQPKKIWLPNWAIKNLMTKFLGSA
jgi:hypothetical protein